MAWTRTVAAEWGRFGITVNSLVPAIWTPMYDEYRARLSPAELAQHDAMMQGRVPIGGKLGDPDRDLAPVMVFLATTTPTSSPARSSRSTAGQEWSADLTAFAITYVTPVYT